MNETEEVSEFGIDAFVLDFRLRLFRFTAAGKRADYLRVLRAFDRDLPGAPARRRLC